VFITIDALRADHLGCYGSDQGLTPNIDAFAQSTTRYDDAYVSSPWTLTSLASMFSQLPPSQCGLKILAPEMHEWYSKSARVPEGIRFLPGQLQDAGYITAAELTNGFLTAERGWQRGFDWFRNEDCGEEGAVSTRAENVTRNALSWLRLNRRRPFFLWVHYIDPHVPYDSPDTPEEVWDRYSRGWPTRREYWYETMRSAPNEMRSRYQEFCRVMYAEEVRYADRWVGKFLEGLNAAADFDNCLVVISSDHGEELFDHGAFEHGHCLYEEVLRVPLLVKWPAVQSAGGGQAADKRITQTVGLISLARTFLDAAGVPPGEADEPPALPRRDGGPDAAIYSEGLLWGIEQTSLATGDYNIIYHPFRQPREQRFEVYDRRRDRAEQHDLAQSGEAADLRDRLVDLTASSEAACRQWRRSGKQSFDGLDLPEQTRDRLKALGYLGD
jgi:arylsulfatase A-like enzyme